MRKSLGSRLSLDQLMALKGKSHLRFAQ